MEHDSSKLPIYNAFLVDKAPWLNFLSVINIIIGLHTAFTLFSLTSSANAVRIYLNIFIIAFTVFSWFIIHQYASLSTIIPTKFWDNNGHDYKQNWAYILIHVFAIAAIPVAGLLLLANTRRLKNGTFILGTVVLVLVGLSIFSIGTVSRDYKERLRYYSSSSSRSSTGTVVGNNWVKEACNIDRRQIESFPCKDKYKYVNKALCPVRAIADVYTCILEPNNDPENEPILCPNAWETSIKPKGPGDTRAVLNERVKGAIVLIFTRPVLTFTSFGLAWVFVGFTIAAFSFYLSSKEKGQQNSNTLNIVFIVIYALFLIIAFLYIGLSGASPLPREPQALAATTLLNKNGIPNISNTHNLGHHSKHGEKISHEQSFKIKYDDLMKNMNKSHDEVDAPDQEDCLKFDAVFQSAPAAFELAADENKVGKRTLQDKNGKEYKKEDLNKLDQFILQDAADKPEKNYSPAYVLCIEGPEKDSANTQAKQIFFKIRDDFETLKPGQVFRVDGYSCGINIIQDFKPTRSYFGLIGRLDAITEIINSHLNICNFND